ncbi:MAG: DUF1697 domain-containing protein [Bacteroidota bacterium]
MPTYIALLRGINVSGQKKIKMADLRAHLEELNFSKISTYIQSGNIVFNAISESPHDLETLIASKIKEKYGFDVPVLIQTPEQIEMLIDRCPYIKDADKDPKKIYLTLLSEEPSADRVAQLSHIQYEGEEYILQDRCIYFYADNGYGKAKMNNNFFENKLKVNATTRNWNTMNKLLDMARGN